MADSFRQRDLRGLLGAGAVGAVLAYLLDPNSGKRRRKMGLDRLAGAFRRGFARVGRLARRTSADTYGVTQKIIHLKPEEQPELLDDVTLAQKVQSEIFRDPQVSKGRINVNVENGVVVLRGELDRPEQIKALEEEARKIPGVRGVESLLHLTNTPPP